MLSYAIGFGLLAAVGWGLGPTASKYAYESGGTPIVAAAVQTVIGTLILWSLTLGLHGPAVVVQQSVDSIWPFVLGGVIGSAIGRYLLYWGIDNIGASINTAVAATDPIFAVVIAVFLLGEIPSWLQIVAVVLAMSGVIVVSLSKGGNIAGWKNRLLLIPFGAAFLYGCSAVLRRFGFGMGDTPIILAAAFGETAALLTIFAAIMVYRVDIFAGVSFDNYGYLLLSGSCYTVGTVAMFGSLAHGPVVVGTTLGSMATLVNVAASVAFLGSVERVTSQTAVGTVIGVCGLTLIAVVP